MYANIMVDYFNYISDETEFKLIEQKINDFCN